jgi:hypothetical protein
MKKLDLKNNLEAYKINLRQNTVCFDDSIWSDFFFWRQPKCDEATDYQKYKYNSHEFEIYEEKKDEDDQRQALLIIQLNIESQKQVNVVEFYKFLTYIGDVGGFLSALELIFAFVGIYFSS